MGYDIVLCEVLSVDLDRHWVNLKPLNSSFIDSIDVETGRGLKFASSYGPFLNEMDPKTGKVNNVPVGVINFPQPGDRVLALIWMSEMTKEDNISSTLSQNPFVEVIILARVIWEHSSLGPYDHILGDQSGAKLHFNHGWLDTVNISELPPEYMERGEAARPQHLRTGHVTLVGNRTVILSGSKFLPFGLFSHLLGQANDDNPIVFPESTTSGTGGGGGRGTAWKEIFTKDPTYANLFDNLLDVGGLAGGEKFLEPPCPDPGEDMHMHDSGYKVLVGIDGHVREYVPKGRIIIIGQDASETEKKMAFDPEGENESGTYPDVAEGVLQIELVSQSKTLTLKFDPTNDIVELTTSSGKFKVTGNIEATLDVKGATGTFG